MSQISGSPHFGQSRLECIGQPMGHATIEETFSRYGHLMPGARDQAGELVDAYLGGAAGRAEP